MNVIEFLKTIYLGDRGCKSVQIDCWNSEVKIQVDCISRVRGAQWNSYTDEDLEDGFLVFEAVKSVSFDPPGHIPNDFINDIRAERLEEGRAKYLIVMNVSSVDDFGRSTEVEIRIEADSIALEDLKNPGKRIRM